MPYALTVATAEDRTVVVDALRAAARQRVTVARKAAGQLAAEKRSGRDVRSSAVKVAALLAEADVLETLAGDLAAAETSPASTFPPPPPTTDAEVADTPPEEGDSDAAVEDDGTSVEARHLADLAGLKAAYPDATEDPVTGALPEDEPTENDLGDLTL